MRKMNMILALFVLISAQQSFAANDPMSIGNDQSDSHVCAMIAKACLAAHYTRKDSANKRFWRDCMKPILMGKTVSGVDIDAATVNSCRNDKIAKMKKELSELQEVK